MSDRIQEILTELDSTDQIVVRFMEDILVALVGNKTISLADVPQVAVQKILHRRRLRSELKHLKEGKYVESVSQHQRGVYLEGPGLRNSGQCQCGVSGVCCHSHSNGICGVWCIGYSVQRHPLHGPYSRFTSPRTEVIL